MTPLTQERVSTGSESLPEFFCPHESTFLLKLINWLEWQSLVTVLPPVYPPYWIPECHTAAGSGHDPIDGGSQWKVLRGMMWSDRCLRTAPFGRWISWVKLQGEQWGSWHSILGERGDGEKWDLRDIEKEHAFVLGNNWCGESYFAPRNHLWFPIIHAIESGLPGLHTLDLPWSPTLNITQQPAWPAGSSLLGPTCSHCHTFAHTGPSAWNILAPSAQVQNTPSSKAASKNHMPTFRDKSKTWLFGIHTTFSLLLVAAISSFFFSSHSNRQELLIIIVFIVM